METRSEASSPADRRRDFRYSTHFDVRFAQVTDAAKAMKAFSINLSAGGLCVRSKTRREVGEVLRLDMTIERDTLSLDGVVAWVYGDALGVRFVNVRPDQKERLEAMSKLLAKANVAAAAAAAANPSQPT
jgi:uncharacterized protein (TIGR02266 family)